jgi:glucan phosphoethanolaminetransferase (alkaline phosphatase superfamily)
MLRLICPVCRKPVKRVDAKFCPHCGVAFKGNWPGATPEWLRWLGLMILSLVVSPICCCYPYYLAPILLLVWFGLVLYPQQLTPVLAQPPRKLWLRDVFLAAISASFFLLITLFLCSISLKAIYGADDQTVYRYLVVGWLLWIVLTASYYLLLIFRTGGKRRLMPRERFVALFCAFVVVFWGFMLLGFKGNP